jgi:hypothetical protein
MAAATLLLRCAGGVAAQSAIILPAVPDCQACALEMVKVATLGKLDRTVLREPLWMARDSLGRFFVTWTVFGHSPELASVFDSTGRFVQSIGRTGSGPGEFLFPVTVNVDHQNRILVWDANASRESVLDAQLHFVRQTSQRSATNVLLHNGLKAIALSTPYAAAATNTIAILDSNSIPLRSFGAPRDAPVGPEGWRMNRVLGKGPGDHVWAAYPDVYRVERWTSSGVLEKVVTRTIPWFEPVRKQAIEFQGEMPSPSPRDLREDSKGRLWVAISVAALEWKDALGAAKAVPGRPSSFPDRSRARLYDTMLDVIDVRTGRLLISKRINGFVKQFLSDDLISVFRESADGEPSIEIWRLTLKSG